jgi:SOS response regulatory protein OraA/RecX
MTTEANSNIETRIRENKHFASLLRQRLKSRHGNGALRERLAQMSDSELIEMYLRNERQGREHSAKQRAEKGGIHGER